MDYFYFYRMTDDTGNAPCVFDSDYKPTELLTLACCKGGQIRHYKNGDTKSIEMGLRYTIGEEIKKNLGDEYYIIGILKDQILYVAKICDALLMKNYFAADKVKNRMDCIYMFCEKGTTENGYSYHLKRRKGFNEYFHGIGDIEQHHRDELGKYVLISNEFIYQGNNMELHKD